MAVVGFHMAASLTDGKYCEKVITKIAANFPSEENPWSQKVNFFEQDHLPIFSFRFIYKMVKSQLKD
jgi:hypothetical protein